MQLYLVAFIIHRFEWFQQITDVILDQQGTPQYTHDFTDRFIQLEVMLDDTNDTVSNDINVYLDADCIPRLSPKGFDPKVLFNPLENSSTCHLYLYKSAISSAVR
jgi:hypothetical protein